MRRLVELGFGPSPIGDISLRRRQDPRFGEVFEVLLDDEYLMSSLFTVAEVALAELALARLTGEQLCVVVGGLGLGHTARAALADDRVAGLWVVEYLPPVVQWHRDGLVPGGAQLSADPRTRYVEADFFALAAGDGFGPAAVDAVLLDIDHSPRHLLGADAGFYGTAGTRALARHLRPGGVYALWSNDPPDQAYVSVLRDVFDAVQAQVVRFPNPLQDREATNTVYLATARG